jgi:hypothetical protein
VDAPDSAAQKHSIVTRHVKISVGVRSVATRLNCLDDPCTLESPNFNEIAFLHFHLMISSW